METSFHEFSEFNSSEEHQPGKSRFGFTQEIFSLLDDLTNDMDQSDAILFKRHFVETVLDVSSSSASDKQSDYFPHCQCDEGCFSRGDCCWDIFKHCSVLSKSFSHFLVNAPRCQNKCNSIYRQVNISCIYFAANTHFVVLLVSGRLATFEFVAWVFDNEPWSL